MESAESRQRRRSAVWRDNTQTLAATSFVSPVAVCRHREREVSGRRRTRGVGRQALMLLIARGTRSTRRQSCKRLCKARRGGARAFLIRPCPPGLGHSSCARTFTNRRGGAAQRRGKGTAAQCIRQAKRRSSATQLRLRPCWTPAARLEPLDGLFDARPLARPAGEWPPPLPVPLEVDARHLLHDGEHQAGLDEGERRAVADEVEAGLGRADALADAREEALAVAQGEGAARVHEAAADGEPPEEGNGAGMVTGGGRQGLLKPPRRESGRERLRAFQGGAHRES